MIFDDLRDFIKKAQDMGECRIVEGADWEEEIGGLTDMIAPMPNAPVLLFDRIKGYPAGYRVVTNLFNTQRRTALAFGLPEEARGLDLVRAMRDRIRVGIKPIPPVEVKTAPVKQNVLTGDDVDLFKFPTPKWHEQDGGRYIGTGSLTIVRDPEEDWINAAPYRIQVQDRNTVTIYNAPGRHGSMIRKKYWDRGQPCPVAISCGQEPAMWCATNWQIPWGTSELAFGGGFRGKPVEVTRGVTTDLLIPATAEIVLEGEILPPEIETRIEGPFGEWSGYYAGGRRPEPAVRIKSILFRDDPIIQGNPPSRLLSVWSPGRHIQRAAIVWDELDRQVPGVMGVWQVEEAAGPSMLIISVKQQYAGHAKQAALVAASSNTLKLNLRWVIVVDDDIDPSSMSEVIWALGTRTDTEAAIDIVRGCTSSSLDPVLAPDKAKRGDLTHGMAIVLACKPYYWMKDFPQSTKTSSALAKKLSRKWSGLLGEIEGGK